MRENADTIEKSADKTYRGDYNRYVEFVKREGIATEAPFISADGVNLYFAEVVAKSVVKPVTAGRRLTALKFYAKIERPSTPVNIETESVKTSLNTQKELYRNHQIEDKKANPHKNLPTNTLKTNDFKRMMEYGFRDQGAGAIIGPPPFTERFCSRRRWWL
jgi:hypothetical protein